MHYLLKRQEEKREDTKGVTLGISALFRIEPSKLGQQRERTGRRGRSIKRPGGVSFSIGAGAVGVGGGWETQVCLCDASSPRKREDGRGRVYSTESSEPCSHSSGGRPAKREEGNHRERVESRLVLE